MWTLRYDGYDPAAEPLREALCTVGNGYFATRGSAPESRPDGVHYPGTYAAGLFNRLSAEASGRHIENESMVNLPDWQALTFRVEGETEWFDIDAVTLLDYTQELDMRRGLLTRRFRYEDAQGRRTAVSQRRLVSMADPHVAALDCTFVAENWSGRLEVLSGLEGRVRNIGVPRYAGLGDAHLETEIAEVVEPSAVLLGVEANQAHWRVGVGARQRVLRNEIQADVERKPIVEDAFVGQQIVLDLNQREPVTVEKIVALYTSRDLGISEPVAEAREKSLCAPDFDQALERHVLAWDHLWERADIRLTGDDEAQKILRLHLFHLLQTVFDHTLELDVGIPARGLHGEAYRGHIFWDETFVYPWLNVRMPELSRSRLRYRYQRLPQARKAANQEGYAGAMFPWQSGSNGREESQVIHLNPRSGRWVPDNSHLQRHINAAIAYNVWQYYQATGDLDFLSQFGAEMIFEIAKFWASIAQYNRARDRYEIRGVLGPDEYHDAVPGSTRPGLDNNSYTNVMAVWTLMRALETVDVLPTRRRRQLMDLLDITSIDVERWDVITRKMRLVWQEGGILSQFQGYADLKEFPWEDYVERYGDISRLDRILEAEGDSANNYKLSKQADVLMLFYLLSEEEIRDIIERLDYRWDDLLIGRNIDYYLQRTSHGSTLSKLVHSWVLARAERPQGWEYFLEALRSDVQDVQGGTTQEGIHLGAVAGTVDLLQRGFTGMETRGDTLWFDPYLPEALGRLEFRIRYREHWGLEVSVDHDQITFSGRRHGAGPPLRVRVQGQEHVVDPGGVIVIPLQRRT